MNPTLYAVGRIVKAFGINGEVFIVPMTPSPLRFKTLRNVFVGQSEEQARADVVEHATVKEKRIRIKLTGIKDRSAASLVVGSFIFVRKDDRLKPGRGEFFIDDLVGLRAIDEQAGEFGVVKEILKLPAQDVYVIDHDGFEVMIPATREFIREVNLDAGTITVRLIEGMLEQG